MRFMLAALVAGGLAVAGPAQAQYYQYQPADPWAVLGGVAAGAIIGGIILEATRPPPPPVVIYQPPPPPPFYLLQPQPQRCGAVYLGDDAWGRPMFGNWCR